MPKVNPLNVLERVVWTFVAAGVAAVPVTLALTPSNLKVAGLSALTAGLAAAVALVKNLVLKVATDGTMNIAERFLWTALQAFVGSLPATIALTGHGLLAIGYSGLTAAVAAVISLAKNVSRSIITVPAVLAAPSAPAAP